MSVFVFEGAITVIAKDTEVFNEGCDVTEAIRIKWLHYSMGLLSNSKT